MILHSYKDLREFFDAREEGSEPVRIEKEEGLFVPSGETPPNGPKAEEPYPTFQDAAKGNIVLANTKYYLYDKALTFDDWLGKYIEEWKERPDFGSTYSNEMFRLLRKDDVDRLENELCTKDHPGLGWMFFCAGRYERAMGLWGDSSREFFKFPTIKGDPVSRNDAAEICKYFQSHGVVGNSDRFLSLYRDLAKLCIQIKKGSLPNILIEGQPGTGKESLSKAIHDLSGRTGEFRAINCAGIPEPLLESELFGYKKGAFTGAESDRDGIIKTCKGGTVQFDEIDKVSGNFHAKLFRALQEREIWPIGAPQAELIDVLFIATTNTDLAAEADNTKKALYGRFRGSVIKTPTVMEMRADIPLLVREFIDPEWELDRYRFPLALWCQGQVNRWSNNVRDLKSEIEAQERRFFKIQAPQDTKEMVILRKGVEAAIKDGERIPITQTKLAESVGCKPHTFHEGLWQPCVQVLVNEGKVKPTNKFPKEG